MYLLVIIVFITDSVTINGTPSLDSNPSIGITIPDIAPGNTTTITFEVKVAC